MNTQHRYQLHPPPRPTDEILKERAHMAFLAYEAAQRDGGAELADAARQRFEEASQLLAGGRRASR